MSVNLSGNVRISGSVAGRDLNEGGGGQVACDFIWKGSAIKGLCFPEDQNLIQKSIDKFVDGKIDVNELIRRIDFVSPNMVAVIRRLTK